MHTLPLHSAAPAARQRRTLTIPFYFLNLICLPDYVISTAIVSDTVTL
jgi:hypothetical protein